MTGLMRLFAVFAAIAVLGGCASPGAVAESATRLVRVALDQMRPKPYSAESNLVLTEEEQGKRLVLDEDEQAAALAVLRSLAADHEPASPPRPAAQGVRWSDVPLAVRYAGEQVEMAIARQWGRVEDDDEMTFLLTTIDGRPVRLEVARTHDERVYEARASVGWFGTDADRAERLLAALEESMKALGRKRGFE